MKPRLEFVAGCALAAALLQVTAFVGLAVSWWGMAAGNSLGRALLWLPAPLLAAGLAAWWSSRAHARARQAGKTWSAFALAWRTVLLALVLYPAFVAGWLLLTAMLDQWFAAQPATLQQTWEILPSIVQYSAIFSVVLGTLPALLIEYFLSRRYLRRIAGNTKSST